MFSSGPRVSITEYGRARLKVKPQEYHTKTGSKIDKVLGALSRSDMTYREISRHTGISRRDVEPVISAMATAGYLLIHQTRKFS